MRRARPTGWFELALLLSWLIAGQSLRAADKTDWNSLKQLGPGQEVQIVLNDAKSYTGEFRSVKEEAIVIQLKAGEETFSRQTVHRVSARRRSRRGRNALIGGAIGAGAGLGIGAAIDAQCGPQSIVCTGNKGKAIGTPLFGLLGAGIGALIPTGGWQEIYRSR